MRGSLARVVGYNELFHRGEERSVCLVSDVGGRIGRIYCIRCVMQSVESFSVQTRFLFRSITFESTNSAGNGS